MWYASRLKRREPSPLVSPICFIIVQLKLVYQIMRGKSYQSYLITQCLWHFHIQGTREDGVPAGANVSLAIHWKTQHRFLFNELFCLQILESLRAECVLTYRWCLSPSIHKSHRGISAAADWGGISRRPWRFSDVPGLCRHLPQSALQVWRNKKKRTMNRCLPK